MNDTPPYRDQRTPIVGTADTVILGGNMRRRSLLIGAPQTNRVTISFGSPAVLDMGLTLYPGGPTLKIDEGHVGSALREEVHAIAAVAPQQIGIIDVFDG